MTDRCKATHEIEDPVCVSDFRCELETGHEGPHRATYPGVEGDISYPLIWNAEGGKTEFVRGGSRRDSDLVPIRR